MKRPAMLIAAAVAGLVGFALAGVVTGTGFAWYTTTGTTETMPTETTTTEVTATVLCPDGGPNTSGKDGEPGNDSCARTTEATTTSAPPATTTETTTETTQPVATTETTETTTEEMTTSATETSPPPVVAPTKPRKPLVKPPCSNGTPHVNGRCHPIVRGSG